jgi:hypothetical protein
MLIDNESFMPTPHEPMTVVGEDFWRWQTMNPDGYRGNSNSASGEDSRTSVIINGSHLNGH